MNFLSSSKISFPRNRFSKTNFNNKQCSVMTKTIPRNDSTKQLSEIVDEIYHVKDLLNSLPRNRLREVCFQHDELLGNLSFVKNETGIFLPLLGIMRTQCRTIVLESNSTIVSTRNTLRTKSSNIAIFLVFWTINFYHNKIIFEILT